MSRRSRNFFLCNANRRWKSALFVPYRNSRFLKKNSEISNSFKIVNKGVFKRLGVLLGGSLFGFNSKGLLRFILYSKRQRGFKPLLLKRLPKGRRRAVVLNSFKGVCVLDRKLVKQFFNLKRFRYPLTRYKVRFCRYRRDRSFLRFWSVRKVSRFERLIYSRFKL